jgi:hypothetical protein
MSARIRYITHVSNTLGDIWQWTKPCKSPQEAAISAENMVSARIMDDRNIKRNFENFTSRLRTIYPEIVEDAQQFIGETREIVLPEDMTPKQFQKEFHIVQYQPGYEEEGSDNLGLIDGDE